MDNGKKGTKVEEACISMPWPRLFTMDSGEIIKKMVKASSKCQKKKIIMELLLNLLSKVTVRRCSRMETDTKVNI